MFAIFSAPVTMVQHYFWSLFQVFACDRIADTWQNTFNIKRILQSKPFPILYTHLGFTGQFASIYLRLDNGRFSSKTRWGMYGDGGVHKGIQLVSVVRKVDSALTTE